MGVKKLENLAAYQLAVEFKLEVYKLFREHPAAQQDLRYRSQVYDAASGVESDLAEGWRRYHAREMALFVRYALSSLEEAKVRVRDGVHRGYFTEPECARALALGNRCGAATMALLKSLEAMPPRKKKPRNPRNRKKRP